MERILPNHYAALGLDRNCTEAQIRAAYRSFAKQLHPDLNCGSKESLAQTQAINAAYEILSDPEQRRNYDQELASAERSNRTVKSKMDRNISRDILLPLVEFIRGSAREIRLDDPAHFGEPEIYTLEIPPGTPPGTKLRLKRTGGGTLAIRVKPFPHFQFKVRGSDLRCDLKIHHRIASNGGEQTIKSVTGTTLRVKISARIARGEIIRVPGEGLPKRGGRGDLLVRVLYRPEIKVLPRGL